MIRPLRRRHAALATVFLALVAPAGLVAGVLTRPEPAVAAGLPEALVPADVLPSGRVDKTAVTVEGVPVTVRTWGTRPERYLQLAPEGDVRVPDVLVYWAPGAAGDPPLDPAAAPPEAAVLLGTFAGARPRSYRLPAAAREGGNLVLYSLAHKRGLASAKLTPGG